MSTTESVAKPDGEYILVSGCVYQKILSGGARRGIGMTPKFLGFSDEPQGIGAVVAVNYGDYRTQELWVSSGANIGNWYPLGGELWPVWDRQQMPAGVTKQHPTWTDVLARGSVVLLTPATKEAYESGWSAGKRHLAKAVEALAEEE